MPTNFEKETNILFSNSWEFMLKLSKQSRFDVFAGIAHVLSDQFLAVQLLKWASLPHHSLSTHFIIIVLQYTVQLNWIIYRCSF